MFYRIGVLFSLMIGIGVSMPAWADNHTFVPCPEVKPLSCTGTTRILIQYDERGCSKNYRCVSMDDPEKSDDWVYAHPAPEPDPHAGEHGGNKNTQDAH